MKNIILSFIGIFFILLNNIHGQDLRFLSMNQEISQREVYIGGMFIIQEVYVTVDNKTIVYSTDIRSMQTYINREYVFGDSFIESNNYLPDGYNYFYSKYYYSNCLLMTEEHEDFFTGNTDKIDFFYDNNRNIIRSVSREIETKYSYLNGKLNLIEYFHQNGGYRSERVEYIDDFTVHTPSYDLYITMDKKIIENRINGTNRIITLTYYLDDQVFEIQRYVFTNDKIESLTIDNRWKTDIEEVIFFWNQESSTKDPP